MREESDFQANAIDVQGWKDLEELRTYALDQGCTPAQFSYAVESVGVQPADVAAYINRHAFASLKQANERRVAQTERSKSSQVSSS